MAKIRDKVRLEAYRKYMGPSGNGMSDATLRKLAGWVSFCAGWDAAIKRVSELNELLNHDRPDEANR